MERMAFRHLHRTALVYLVKEYQEMDCRELVQASAPVLEQAALAPEAWVRAP